MNDFLIIHSLFLIVFCAGGIRAPVAIETITSIAVGPVVLRICVREVGRLSVCNFFIVLRLGIETGRIAVTVVAEVLVAEIVTLFVPSVFA